MLMIVFMILLFFLSVVCVYVLNKESTTINVGPESTIKNPGQIAYRIDTFYDHCLFRGS